MSLVKSLKGLTIPFALIALTYIIFGPLVAFKDYDITYNDLKVFFIPSALLIIAAILVYLRIPGGFKELSNSRKAAYLLVILAVIDIVLTTPLFLASIAVFLLLVLIMIDLKRIHITPPAALIVGIIGAILAVVMRIRVTLAGEAAFIDDILMIIAGALVFIGLIIAVKTFDIPQPPIEVIDQITRSLKEKVDAEGEVKLREFREENRSDYPYYYVLEAAYGLSKMPGYEIALSLVVARR